MGLARPAGPARQLGVGVDGAPAGRVAGPLGPLARLPVGRRWTSRTWSRGWTGSAAVWAGSPGSGGSTGWPPSASPAPAGSPPRSPASRSTTASMIKICPPRAGHRKGVVEKINHTAAQRWWRTLADELTVEQAQADCDRFAAVRGDTRLRRRPAATGGPPSPPSPPRSRCGRSPPTAYPVLIDRDPDRVTAGAGRLPREPVLGATRTGRRPRVTVSRPVGAAHLDIATTTGIVIARHRLAADGAGAMVRDHGHVAALEAAAMAAAAAARGPHRRKERIPPGPPPGPPPTPSRGEPQQPRSARSSTWPPTNAPPTEGTP